MVVILLVDVSKPWVCSSTGDPHISPYPGGRTDLVVPGSQMPGTYTLTRIGERTSAEYFLLQADQQLCNARPNIYCNKRTILKVNGKVIEINCDKVIVEGVQQTFTGTYNVGNNVTITKSGAGVYTVNYPNGNTRTVCRGVYMDIFNTVTQGEQPSGGVCTQTSGTGSVKRVLAPIPFLKSCMHTLSLSLS